MIAAALFAALRDRRRSCRVWANRYGSRQLLIFAATYLVIALGKLPGFYLDRAGAALLGAALMVGCGVLSFDRAMRAIDFDTIALLLGMMIVVGNLRLSGFFRLVTNWVVTRARHPLLLLGAVIATSGCFSAFLVNDTICLALTPLVLDLVVRLRRDPVPYLLAVAMASNVGSVATITGNPQNTMIGSFSAIPYAAFAAALTPVALIGLILTFGLIALLHPTEFWQAGRLIGSPIPAHAYRPLLVKSVVVTIAMMAGFFAGQAPAKAALVAGAVMLVTRTVRSEKIYREIDWPLLLMFAGLFVVVAGFEHVLVSPALLSEISHQQLDRMPILAASHRDPVKYRQQCPGRAGAEAVCCGTARSAARLACRRDVGDLGRQFDDPRFGRQSDCCSAGGPPRPRYRILAIFPRWCPVDGANDYRRPAMVVIDAKTPPAAVGKVTG